MWGLRGKVACVLGVSWAGQFLVQKQLLCKCGFHSKRTTVIVLAEPQSLYWYVVELWEEDLPELSEQDLTHSYLHCREIPMTSDELQFLIEKILRWWLHNFLAVVLLVLVSLVFFPLPSFPSPLLLYPPPPHLEWCRLLSSRSFPHSSTSCWSSPRRATRLWCWRVFEFSSIS